MGVALENVFLGQVDSSGDLFLDIFDDAVEIPQPKVKDNRFSQFLKGLVTVVKTVNNR